MTDAKQILRQPASWGGVGPQGPSAPGVPNTQGVMIMELWHDNFGMFCSRLSQLK